MAEKGSKPPSRKTGRQGIDELLISAFLIGATWRDAGQHAGIGQTTVARKLRDPRFQKKLVAAKRELVARTTRRAASFALESLATLRSLSIESTDESIRLRAAVALLEVSVSFTALDELEARICELENARRARDGDEPLSLIA
jgi:hypothetical protein